MINRDKKSELSMVTVMMHRTITLRMVTIIRFRWSKHLGGWKLETHWWKVSQINQETNRISIKITLMIGIP